jgi:hypothetical protein
MRLFLVFAAVFMFFVPANVLAQSVDDPIDVVSEPICFKVRNEAPYKVYGSFITNYYTAEDGAKARHRSNFRLDEPGSTNAQTGEPSDQSDFCTYGPFLPDRKLELVIRTLVPIFSCKTKVDQGEIVIKGYRKPEGGTDTFAECYE